MRQKFALYRSLKGKLTVFLPLVESQLHNLIWFLIGLCCAGDVRLPKLATEIPYTHKCESLVQRLWRFLKNTRMLPKTVYHVVAKQFLTCWQGRQLHMIIDRMPLKHHSLFCIALSFRRRAIPVVWDILPKKGATNFRQQSALIRECLSLIPETCDVILLGDREFRSIALMRFLKRHNWHFREVAALPSLPPLEKGHLGTYQSTMDTIRQPTIGERGTYLFYQGVCDKKAIWSGQPGGLLEKGRKTAMVHCH